MATLQIRKKAEKVFIHVPSDQAEFIISKFYISIDGLEFQVVEQGQSKRNKYLLSDITVYDDTVGGSAETFTTIEELSERLVALKYNGFYNENESLFNAFTDLVDTPSSYTGQNGKVVAVKSDASGLEFITGGGGGSTPTLQDVLDEGGDYTKTSGTATVTGNKGVYNAGQNSFIENFTIETTDGDVLRTAAFGASKAGYSFSHSVTDLVTGETTSSGLGMNEGVFSLESLVNDGTDESTHRIEFDIDPTLNDTLTLKTPNDEIGEKVFATREWVNSEIPTNTSDLINDGENGTSPYVTADQLPSNLSLFATNASSDIATYFKLVTSIDDPDYNDTAVDISTGAITTTNQFIASLATSAGVLLGNPGIVNLTTVGNIRRTSGTGNAEFYYEVYHRDSGGTETLIATSSATPPVTVSVYTEFIALALLNNGTFLPTDRIVVKYYGNRISGGSNPTYQFQFGGTSPVRTSFPVPASNLPFSLDTLSDVNITTPLNGQVLIYDDGVWINDEIPTIPTLQDVRDENPNVTVENPNDANNVGLWNSLQYDENDLRVEDGLLIEALSGDVQQVTSRFSDSATIQIQGSIYDSVTEDSLQSILGVEQGKAFVLEIINDSTLNQGSHKIELDPAIGEEVIFKTPNDATTGTETIATREWVEDNVEKIIVSESNGTFGTHTGNTAETVLLAIDISANEFEAGDRLIFKIFTDKSAGVENVQFRVRVGTTGTTSDSLIATSANFTGNNARYMMFDRQRIAFLTGNSVRAASAQVAGSTDINALNGSSAFVSLNPTLAWKFVITAQLSAGAETTNLVGYTISKIKSF